jgi:hypothetical protein
MRQILIVTGCVMAAMPLGWMAAKYGEFASPGNEPRFPN